MRHRNGFTLLFRLIFMVFIYELVDADQRKRISVNRGLNDAEAIVGKLFRYTIAADAFDGDFSRYEVIEAGSTELPKWLIWDSLTATLSGIPGEDDLGPNYIQVTAIGDENSPDLILNTVRTNNRAKDIFSIHVYDEYPNLSTRIPFDERILCDDGPAATMTLTVDVNFDSLSADERIELILTASKVFNVSKSAFRLFSSNDDGFTSMKRIIQVASSVTPSPNMGSDQQLSLGSQTMLTWKLSCDQWASVEPFMDIVGKLQKMEVSGTLKDILKNRYPVLSWYLAMVSHEHRRRRRQGSNVTPHSYGGATGPTWAIDVTTSIPTSSTSIKTSTIRMRPTSFTDDWTQANKTTISVSSNQPITTTVNGTSSISTRTRATVSPFVRSTTTINLITRRPNDEKPILKNSLGTLRCPQNQVCYLSIPANTFDDKEDGDTAKLKLHLDVLDDVQKRSSWLLLDETRQLLIGLPTESGNFLFRLTATDSGNRHASDAFSVEVEQDHFNDDKLHHRVSIQFTVPDEQNFTNNVRYRLLFLEKLAQYFSNSKAENIRFKFLNQDGLVLIWNNVSLAMDRCAKNELQAISNRLFREDGQVRAAFRKFMHPPFSIHKGHMEYSGLCAGLKGTLPTGKPTVGQSAVETSVGVSEFEDSNVTTIPTTVITASAATRDDLFISTILPIIIIVLFLIVASLVACILYKKNRRHKKGKMESKSDFISKGAPVIFPDEMELDKESTAATPMLLKDEKPPLQPLDFTAAGEKPNGNGAGNGASQVRSSFSTPSSGPGRVLGKTQVSEAETALWQRPLLQDTEENPLYRPPPAFEPAGMKENRSPRPKHASPQQRDPPPYVPP